MSCDNPPFYGSVSFARNNQRAATPLWITEWKSCVLARPITATSLQDACAAYPLFQIGKSADIRGGLEKMRAEHLISFVGILDPVRHGKDVARLFSYNAPLKVHYVVRGNVPYAPSKHHRTELRRAEKICVIESGPVSPWLTDWDRLYADQSNRWTELHRFGMAHWLDICVDPRLTAFRCVVGGEITAMALVVRQDGHAYYHLAANTPSGRRQGAAYALVDAMIDANRDLESINLGGGLARVREADGLAKFKEGFANSEIVATLVGEVLDDAVYRKLSADRGSSFFPAYRTPSNQAAGTME
jgi:hypothetical protein